MMADSLDLSGKIAIVTGSGRENGIGAGIALALARNGASVAVNFVSDSTQDRAARVVETLREAGGQAIAIQAAVDTLEGARELVVKTLEGFNATHIDILGMRPLCKAARPRSPSVNNAGTAFFSPILGEPNVEQLAKIFQLNVIGPFFMVNSVVPHMPRGGRIINISSTNAKRGNAAISSYAASKAALDNLTWTWAEEVGLSPCCDATVLTFPARPQQGHHRQLGGPRPGVDRHLPQGPRGGAHGSRGGPDEG
jgi:NAD(P)-dependent dehydrogenase (short-subunit alcohol dehydrogenase family)